MEKLEEYYEIYKYGELYTTEDDLATCRALALSSIEESCTEVYKITVMKVKEKVM